VTAPAWRTRTAPTLQPEELLKPAEAAAAFGVIVRTVGRWNQEGRLPCIRLPGGHRRYRAADVRQLLAERTQEKGTP
jgi:excisionase family DNA binding protein